MEQKAAHTPGPWRATSRNIENVANWASRIPFAIEIEVGHSVVPIADVCDQPAAEANARLIAAAPDLLEALQWYEAKAVQMGRAAIHQDSKLMLALMKEIAVEYGAQARAAIAKATGEK